MGVAVMVRLFGGVWAVGVVVLREGKGKRDPRAERRRRGEGQGKRGEKERESSHVQSNGVVQHFHVSPRSG